MKKFLMSSRYTPEDLLECLQKLEVEKGDCLFIHSSIKKIGQLTTPIDQPYFEALLAIFTRSIGEVGTIVVPTFNFDFCEGKIFDIKNTPGIGMGAFSEYIRLLPNSSRSMHPFHSVAAIGKHAEFITSSNGFSEFSNGSSFDALLKLNCKIVFFGIEFVETFVHIAEERVGVPYRFWKKFSGQIVDKDNSLKQVSINFYARNLTLIPEPTININKVKAHLISKGILRDVELCNGSIGICESNALVLEMMYQLKKDPLWLLHK